MSHEVIPVLHFAEGAKWIILWVLLDKSLLNTDNELDEKEIKHPAKASISIKFEKDGGS